MSNRILSLKTPSHRCLLRTSAHKHATKENGEIVVTSALLSSKFSDFARSLVQEESQKEAKKRITRDLNKFLKLEGVDCGLVAKGSTVNGFGMNDSGLDLCMVFDESRDSFSKTERKEVLSKFRRALRRYNKEGGQVANIEPVGGAKVPIAKIDAGGIPCYVSFNNIIGIRWESSVGCSINISKFHFNLQKYSVTEMLQQAGRPTLTNRILRQKSCSTVRY